MKSYARPRNGPKCQCYSSGLEKRREAQFYAHAQHSWKATNPAQATFLFILTSRWICQLPRTAFLSWSRPHQQLRPTARLLQRQLPYGLLPSPALLQPAQLQSTLLRQQHPLHLRKAIQLELSK